MRRPVAGRMRPAKAGRMRPASLRSASVAATAVGTKLVYDFSEGSREMRELLGGKGANVAEMTRVLGADRVPAGFTITTEACVQYMARGRDQPDGLAQRVADALARPYE